MDTPNEEEYSSIVTIQAGNATKFPLEALGTKDTKRHTNHITMITFLNQPTNVHRKSAKRGTS